MGRHDRDRSTSADRTPRARCGVVACEALYNAVERYGRNADIRYVPQELHEFPTSVPDEDGIDRAIRAAIDDLDTPDRDRIVVLYAGIGEVCSFQTAHATVVVPPVTDCVELFLDRPADPATGEAKAPNTYYLTRGTIDCGIDGYKLYAAYREELDPLCARFERAAAKRPGLRCSWSEGDRFVAAIERGRQRPIDGMGSVFYELLGGFDRIVLLDTGDLYDIHHEYAASFRRFLQRLHDEHGNGGSVDLQVIDGDSSRIEDYLAAVEETAIENLEECFDTYRPE